MTAENRRFRFAAAGLALLILAGNGMAGAAEDADKPRLRISFAERFRVEAWDNAVNLDDESGEGSAYARMKTTLGLRWSAAKKLEIGGELTAESRAYLMPKDRPFDWHEVFFESLYAKWRMSGGFPLTVTAGRQDIAFGEGFVVADGTPLDGSRSYYFNAVRLDYDPRPAHRLTAFFHALDTTDRLLPVVHDQNQALVEQPEKALALYYSGGFGKTGADAYIIWKGIGRTDPGIPSSSFTTFGARIEAALADPLLLTVEGAVQSGSFGETGRRACGGIGHLDYTPGWKIPFLKTLVLGGIYLSGDRPETERLEAWDPLFSRWPKWSNGYLLTFTRESRPSYWSNMTSVYGSILLDFGDRAGATLTLHRLGADELQPGDFPGGSGLGRGTLMVNQLNFTVSRRLTGHLKWEIFRPGDFYFPGADGFSWLRFELHYRH